MPLYLIQSRELAVNAVCFSNFLKEEDVYSLIEDRSLEEALAVMFDTLALFKNEAYCLDSSYLDILVRNKNIYSEEVLNTIVKFVLKRDIILYLIIQNQLKSFTSLIELNNLDKYLQHFQVRTKNLSAPKSYLHEEEFRVKFSKELNEIELEKSETFVEMLFRLIDAKHKTDVEVYKKANIDRKLFSKIRSDINYSPGKKTAVAFAIALELNLDKTQDLLFCAGYQLTTSKEFDLIIRYCIKHKIYDIYKVNEYLYYYDQVTLG